MHTLSARSENRAFSNLPRLRRGYALLALVFLCREGVCGDVVNPKLGATTTAAQTIPTGTSDWLSHPPAWVTWLSLIGGVGAFAWKLYEFLVARSDRDADQHIATEAFWYESIVVPRIVEPLLDFLIDQNEKQSALPVASTSARAKFDTFNVEFQEGYNRLAAKIRVLQVISAPVHSEIMKRLDTLEDAVALYCYKAGHDAASGSPSRRESVSLNAHFSDTLAECITKFKDLHFRLRRPS